MQILAIERELSAISAAEHRAVLAEEAARVWELKKAGVVREIWFDSHRCAVVLLECTSEQEARAYLASLPLVQAGLIAFEVRVLKPYDGFDRLIAPPPRP